MKKFKFRLETLAQVRDREVDHRRQELAKACQKSQMALEKIAEIEAEQQLLEQGWREMLKRNEISSEDPKNYQSYRRLLGQNLERAQRNLQEARKAETEAREQLVIARRESKILENLKKRQEQQHRSEAQRLEQAELDETANTRVAREKGQK